MINIQKIIKEVDSLEAIATGVLKRCRVLKAELQPVSTGRSKKKPAMSAEETTERLGKRHLRRYKNVKS